MEVSNVRGHNLGVFKLLMIAIISVGSIRNLPIGAQYGAALITFYLIAGIAFFLPLLLVTNFLARRYPTTGGSYVWVEAVFGSRWGFVSVWLQWVYNIIWYPTIFAFISTTVAALIHPAFENSNVFILLCSLVLFWAITCMNCFGVRALSFISATSAIVGTLVPMLIIVILAAYWVLSGHPSATPLTWNALIPTQGNLANLAFFANILFSLLGIDVIAMHGGDVRNPSRTYPRVLGLAGVIILGSLICSSFALCVVVSPEKIGLVSGLIDVFNLFFGQYHIMWAEGLICFAIILGGLGITASWMNGLSRGLQVASLRANVPDTFRRLNAHQMPAHILILQGIVFTALMCVFLLLPDINNSYWILSSMTAQFALLYYMLLFAAAFRLMRKEGQAGRYVVFIILAMLASLAGIGVGFLPPSTVIGFTQVLHYESIICLGGAAFFVPLLFFLRPSKRAPEIRL